MTPAATAILKLFDQGHTPRAICAAGFRKDRVYATLRAERPGRKRAPRTRTSPKAGRVAALAAAGVKVTRIAELLCVSRAYCYKVLSK